MKKVTTMSTIYDLMFDRSDYYDGNVNNMLKNCLPTLLKIQTFSDNTDQIQTNFKRFSEKSINFYKPLCHHCTILR